jgi:hypothetical protein
VGDLQVCSSTWCPHESGVPQALSCGCAHLGERVLQASRGLHVCLSGSGARVTSHLKHPRVLLLCV